MAISCGLQRLSSNRFPWASAELSPSFFSLLRYASPIWLHIARPHVSFPSSSYFISTFFWAVGLSKGPLTQHSQLIKNSGSRGALILPLRSSWWRKFSISMRSLCGFPRFAPHRLPFQDFFTAFHVPRRFYILPLLLFSLPPGSS